MLLLELDTTIAKVAKVEVFQDGKKLSSAESTSPLLAIKEALQRGGQELANVDQFESKRGPGSFTGVRIGAVVANTLNWVLQKDSKQIEPIYE